MIYVLRNHTRRPRLKILKIFHLPRAACLAGCTGAVWHRHGLVLSRFCLSFAFICVRSSGIRVGDAWGADGKRSARAMSVFARSAIPEKCKATVKNWYRPTATEDAKGVEGGLLNQHAISTDPQSKVSLKTLSTIVIMFSLPYGGDSRQGGG